MKRRFAELDDVSIDVEVIRGTDRRSWVNIAESELTIPLPAEHGPLWRVKYVDFAEISDVDGSSVASECTVRSEALAEGALMFIIHQAIADSVSMFHMLQTQLIPIINAVIGGEDTSLFDMPLLMMHSADDAFLDKTKSPWNRKASIKLPTVSEEQTPDIENFRPLLSCVASNAVPTHLSASGVLPFTLSTLGTRMFLDECFKQRVAPHAAILLACADALGIISAVHPEVNTTGDILSGYTVDLRKLRSHDNTVPLGMWEGYNTEKMKRNRNLPEVKLFWEQAREISSNSQSGNSKPWKILAAYNDTLKRFTKTGDINSLADLFRVHFQLDDLGNCDALPTIKPKPPSRPVSSIEVPPETLQNGSSSSGSSSMDFIRFDEHFCMRSMSDVNTVPFLISVCCFRSRLMWSVTFNTRWITRRFATEYIDVLVRVIKHVVSTRQWISLIPPPGEVHHLTTSSVV